MPPTSTPWAVILAGGDGARLRPLTQHLTGDARPKQFCRLFGGQTLLDQTRRRADLIIRPDRGNPRRAAESARRRGYEPPWHAEATSLSA